MPDSDLSGIFEPFLRASTMFGNDFGMQKLYMIDKNFNFVTYCVEGYLEKELKFW